MIAEQTRARWAIPYIDQPGSFWQGLVDRYAEFIDEVYFPPPISLIGSGRPELPAAHLDDFLAHAPVPKALLLNAVTLPGAVHLTALPIIDFILKLRSRHGVSRVTVANLSLAERIREAVPDLTITASVLMDVTRPNQALMLDGICDVLVPGAHAMRHLPSLRVLKAAFPGKLRLLVNEACLGGCPFRTQHFHEMCTGVEDPRSLCESLLKREPWMRLTGAWVVPQYLHYYEGLYDSLKLAGRGTLQHPQQYLDVLASYLERRPLLPNQIGGGPASLLEPIEMPEDLYAFTLHCGQQCHSCRRCEEYYYKATEELHS